MCCYTGRQQEQVQETASAGKTGVRDRARSRCCGFHQAHPLGRRTTRQNDGRRHIARCARWYIGIERVNL